LAARQAAAILTGALLVLAVVGACPDLRAIRRIVVLLLLAGLAVCAPALTQYSSVKGSAGAAIVAGATGIFSEHNQLGGFAAVALMLSLGASLGARSAWSAIAAAAIAVVGLLTVSLALSRGAYLGTLLGITVLLATSSRARRAFRVAFLPLVLSAALLTSVASSNRQITLVVERLQSLSSPLENPQDSRADIWAEAGRQIQQHPWTGSGPGNFPLSAMQPGSRTQYAVPHHAHNVLLTTAAEVGLPAAAIMILLTLLWAQLLRRTIRRLGDSRDQALVASLAAALAVFVAQGTVDVILRSPVMLMLLCTCLGLGLAAASVPGALVHHASVEIGLTPHTDSPSRYAASAVKAGFGANSRVKRPKLS
jgi:O-antigen ligase